MMQTRIGLAVWLAFAATGCDSVVDDVATTPTDSGRDSTDEIGLTAPDSDPDFADVGQKGNPAAPADAEAGVQGDADAAGPCLGVCASASFGCARSYPTMDCLQHVCCELPEDGGPPTLDGSCPTSCSSPDDIGCPGTWYRSASCESGGLCCGPTLAGHGTDGG